MIKFYDMADNTNLSRGWVYASKIYPQSEEMVINCDKCGSVARFPKGEFNVDVERGSNYPDIMLCGAFPLLIVSEKVKNDWDKDGIKGFRSYDVKINNVNSQKLKSIKPPHYHHIVVDLYPICWTHRMFDIIET